MKCIVDASAWWRIQSEFRLDAYPADSLFAEPTGSERDCVTVYRDIIFLLTNLTIAMREGATSVSDCLEAGDPSCSPEAAVRTGKARAYYVCASSHRLCLRRWGGGGQPPFPPTGATGLLRYDPELCMCVIPAPRTVLRTATRVPTLDQLDHM